MLREYILFAEQYGVELDYEDAVVGKSCLTTRMQLAQADGLKRYEENHRGNFSMLFSVGGGEFCRQEGNAFSINAASKNKEGAWEFIWFLLSREMQEKIRPNGLNSNSRTVYHTGFPVRRDLFEQALQEASAEADYTDEQKEQLGYGIEARLNGPGTECLTETEAELIRKLADHSRVDIWDADSTPWQIIFDEVSYYFDHTKDLDECLDIIENRLRLYQLEQ